MKNAIITFILRSFLGKNSANLARRITTWIGGLLLSSVIFTGAIDAAIDIDPDFNPITEEEIDDGLTVGELIRALIGFALFQGSRVMSYLRGRNWDWAAEWVGIFIGRSLPSFFRALMTLTSSALVYVGITESAEGLPGVPLVDIIVGIIAFLIAGISSYLQDSKVNPVATSPKANTVPVVD